MTEATVGVEDENDAENPESKRRYLLRDAMSILKETLKMLQKRK